MKRRWQYDEVLVYQKEHNQSWIYLNKEDKNIIVPRNDGFLPWTINGANPFVWFIVLIVIIVVLVGIIIGGR